MVKKSWIWKVTRCPMLQRTAVLHVKEGMRWPKKNGGPGERTSGRFARALYLDDALRDFDPEVAFSLSTLNFQIPGLTDRPGRKETSAPRPCVTNPLPTAQQLGPLNWSSIQMVFIWQTGSNFSSIWSISACAFVEQLKQSQIIVVSFM